MLHHGCVQDSVIPHSHDFVL